MLTQETELGYSHIPSWWINFINPSERNWESRHLKYFIDENCKIFKKEDTDAIANQIKEEIGRVADVASNSLEATFSLQERLTVFAYQKALGGEKELVEAVSKLPQAQLSPKDAQILLGVVHLVKAINRSGVVKSSVDREMHEEMKLSAFHFVSAVSV